MVSGALAGGACAAPAPAPASAAIRTAAGRTWRAMCARYAPCSGSRNPRAAQRGQHLVAVDADRPVRVGVADELQADRRRPEPLELADALDVLVGIGADDEALLGELLVGDLLAGLALHLLRAPDVVAVDGVHLGGLPARGAVDGLLLVLGPGEAALEDHLAGPAAVVGARLAVGLDDAGRQVGVAHRPHAIAPLARDPRRLLAERGDVELRLGARAGVEPGLAQAEPAAVHRHGLTVPQAHDRLQPAVEALEHLVGRGPVEAERRLVERLARAGAEPDAAGEQLLEAHEGLGDDGRVVAVDDGRDARPDRQPGRLAERAQVDQGVARLSVGEPGCEVVRAAEAVEAGALGGLRVAQQLGGRELLVRAREPELDLAHAGRLPP